MVIENVSYRDDPPSVHCITQRFAVPLRNSARPSLSNAIKQQNRAVEKNVKQRMQSANSSGGTFSSHHGKPARRTENQKSCYAKTTAQLERFKLSGVYSSTASMPASIPGNSRYSARANQPSAAFDVSSYYRQIVRRDNSARAFSQRSNHLANNPNGSGPPIKRPHPSPSFRKAEPVEAVMPITSQFGPISVKTCALVQRPPSSSSNTPSSSSRSRRHGWGAAFESTTDSNNAQQLAPDFGKSTIVSFGAAQGKALATGTQRISRGLLAHAAALQDGTCVAMPNTTHTSQQSKMEIEAGGYTPDDGMDTRSLRVSPSSAPVAEGAPVMAPKLGGESMLENSSEVTAFVKTPRAMHTSDPGCRPFAGEPAAAVPAAKRPTLPNSAEKMAPARGPSTPRTTSAKTTQQSSPKPKPRAMSAVSKQQQARRLVASETRMQSSRLSSGHHMPCHSKSESITQHQNRQKEPIKGDQLQKLKENGRKGRSAQSETSPGKGNKSLRSSPAADAEEERKAQERALKLSAEALAKWRKKAKQLQVKAGILQRVVPQMDVNGVPNNTSTEYWDSMAQDWDGEIQSTIDEDRNGTIHQYMDKGCQLAQESCPSAATGVTAVDFGCGVCKWIPALVERCKCVEGIDISRRLLEVGRKDLEKQGIRNVLLKRADLANVDLTKKGVPIAELVACANVLISPEPCTCTSILLNIWKNLVPNGILLLLVPASESATMIQKRHLQWLAYRRERGYASDAALEAPEKTVKEDETRNVYQRDGVRTQHYTSRKLKLMCEKAGFKFLDCDRVDYEWDTELPEPTGWMGAPYPFDWLVMAQKVDGQTSSAARPEKTKS